MITVAGSGTRKQGGDDLKVQHLNSRAEASTNKWFDHSDAGDVHIETACQHQLEVIANLSHALDRESLCLRIKLGKDGVRLNLRVIYFAAADPVLAHEIGLFESRCDVAEDMMDFALDIAGLVVMQQRCAIGARRCRGIIGG